MHINRSVPPLDDVRVRRASAHAINVDEIIRFVGADVAPKGCSVVPPGYLGERLRRSRLCLRSRQGQGAARRSRPCRRPYPQGRGLQRLVPAADHGDHPGAARQGRHQARDERGRSLDVSRRRSARTPAPSSSTARRAFRSPTATSPSSTIRRPSSAGRPRSPTSRIAPSPMPRSRRRGANPTMPGNRSLWQEAQRKIHDDVCAVPLFDLLQVWAHTPRLDFGYKLKGALNLGAADHREDDAQAPAEQLARHRDPLRRAPRARRLRPTRRCGRCARGKGGSRMGWPARSGASRRRPRMPPANSGWTSDTPTPAATNSHSVGRGGGIEHDVQPFAVLLEDHVEALAASRSPD